MGTKKTDHELVADMLIRMEAAMAMKSVGRPLDYALEGDAMDAYELFCTVEAKGGEIGQLCQLLRDAMERNKPTNYMEISFVALSVLAPRRCVLTEGAFAEPEIELSKQEVAGLGLEFGPESGPTELEVREASRLMGPSAPSGDEWAEAWRDWQMAEQDSEADTIAVSGLRKLYKLHREAKNV